MKNCMQYIIIFQHLGNYVNYMKLCFFFIPFTGIGLKSSSSSMVILSFPLALGNSLHLFSLLLYIGNKLPDIYPANARQNRFERS